MRDNSRSARSGQLSFHFGETWPRSCHQALVLYDLFASLSRLSSALSERQARMSHGKEIRRAMTLAYRGLVSGVGLELGGVVDPVGEKS